MINILIISLRLFISYFSWLLLLVCWWYMDEVLWVLGLLMVLFYLFLFLWVLEVFPHFLTLAHIILEDNSHLCVLVFLSLTILDLYWFLCQFWSVRDFIQKEEYFPILGCVTVVNYFCFIICFLNVHLFSFCHNFNLELVVLCFGGDGGWWFYTFSFLDEVVVWNG